MKKEETLSPDLVYSISEICFVNAHLVAKLIIEQCGEKTATALLDELQAQLYLNNIAKEETMKPVKLEESVQHRLKVYAAELKMTMSQVIDMMLKQQGK